jgi:hypothetical protein
MSETTLPDRRALYLLNPAPMVLTQAQLDAMDADPEGVALVQNILDRKQAAEEKDAE